MDFYSCSGLSLLWVCFFQTIAIGWFFGADRFCDCVEQMTGHKPGIFWFLCWKYFAPGVMLAVFVFYVISYTPVTYGKDYKYPGWGEAMGLCMSFASMMWVPLYAIYYVCSQPGSFMEVSRIKYVNFPKLAELFPHQFCKKGLESLLLLNAFCFHGVRLPDK